MKTDGRLGDFGPITRRLEVLVLGTKESWVTLGRSLPLIPIQPHRVVITFPTLIGDISNVGSLSAQILHLITERIRTKAVFQVMASRLACPSEIQNQDLDVLQSAIKKWAPSLPPCSCLGLPRRTVVKMA
ncbi:Mitochondrial import receptor subunit TOM40B, partial [Ophiophagus hannah]